MQSTNDAQIRELLIPFVHQEHSNAPDTIFLEEFALYGGTNRADLAAFNGVSHGYEIKSDRDTLLRLPHHLTGTSVDESISPTEVLSLPSRVLLNRCCELWILNARG